MIIRTDYKPTEGAFGVAPLRGTCVTVEWSRSKRWLDESSHGHWKAQFRLDGGRDSRIGVKDLFDTAGIPTSYGAEPYRDRVPKENASVVARLEEAGVVLTLN
jgi:Asp-tRNA(Asn)/Glu-tRNA(Gln) amidotransferase A subunit family amidase